MQNSNMVGESKEFAKGSSRKSAGAIISQVKVMEFDRNVPLNSHEWEKSVMEVLAANEMTDFISPVCCVKIDREDSQSAVAKKGMERQIQRVRKAMKEQQKVREVVGRLETAGKGEAVKEQDKAATKGEAAKEESKAGSGLSFLSPSTSVPLPAGEFEDEDEFGDIVGFTNKEKCMRELREELSLLFAAHTQIEKDLVRFSKEAEGRGVQPPCYFGKYIFMEERSEKFPFRAIYKEEVVYCDQETAESRERRMISFDCIAKSIEGGVSQEAIESFARGDTAALLAFVVKSVIPRGREHVIEEVDDTLKGFRKDPNELFEVFLTRLNLVLKQARDVNYAVDKDKVKGYVRTALRKSGCKLTVKVYDQLFMSTYGFKDMTHTHILEGMRLQMVEFEGIAVTEDREVAMAGRREDRREETAQKRSEKKDKLRVKKAQAEAKQVQLAQQQPPQSQQSGVRQWRAQRACIAYQSDSCKHGQMCHFQHKKVSKAELEAMERQREESVKRKAEIVCNSCGQKGHYASSPSCPNCIARNGASQAARTRVVSHAVARQSVQSVQHSGSQAREVSSSQESLLVAMRQSTDGMNDKEFVSWLLNRQ
jgi:uncharacterized CHY-type Zn-finger protein